MATKFKKGDAIKLNTPVPQGTVAALRMDEDGNVSYMMEWQDGENTHARWFAEEQLTQA
jgi:hypothetical protein